MDSFGVGERLITARSEPVFGAVYKIAAVEEEPGHFVPRIKISENIEKITNPGLKKVYRIVNEEGRAIADMLAIADEEVEISRHFLYVDPVQPWKYLFFENCKAIELQQQIMKDGRLVYELPSLDEIASYVKRQLSEEIWEEEQRFEYPHLHYLDMTPDYYEMKMQLLNDLSMKESL